MVLLWPRWKDANSSTTFAGFVRAMPISGPSPKSSKNRKFARSSNSIAMVKKLRIERLCSGTRALLDSYRAACRGRGRHHLTCTLFNGENQNGTAGNSVTGKRTRSSRLPRYSRQIRRCRTASNDNAALDDDEFACHCSIGDGNSDSDRAVISVGAVDAFDANTRDTGHADRRGPS